MTNISIDALEQIDKLFVFERDRWRCQMCGRKCLKDQLGKMHPKAPEFGSQDSDGDGGRPCLR